MQRMRPRIGAVLAVLAVAAFPSAARAQAPDTTGPVITLTAPADNAVFTVGQAVVASYSCSDDTQVADCAGPVADGAALDTSTPGDRRFTVTAHDSAGNAGTLTHAYKVMPVLTLTLGQAPAFAPFLPGAGNDYTATMTATVESSAGSALLTMADPSASHPGHLMNGDAALPS